MRIWIIEKQDCRKTKGDIVLGSYWFGNIGFLLAGMIWFVVNLYVG